tara:strand:+ start:3682 stop:4050 length:369 start_codon:yes stop_codon:yes gene_type:complete
MSALLLSFNFQKQDNASSPYFLPETSFAIEIESENSKPSVLYFGATWCNPCKTTKKNLESIEVKKELERFNFKMYDVDIDKKEKEKYKIKLIPTIIVLKDSKIYRYIGGKSKTELIKILKKY